RVNPYNKCMHSDHEGQISKLKHELKNSQSLLDTRTRELKAIESLARATVGIVKEDHIYQSLSQIVVQQLKWDGALVVHIDREVAVKATFHLTQKQLRQAE